MRAAPTTASLAILLLACNGSGGGSPDDGTQGGTDSTAPGSGSSDDEPGSGSSADASDSDGDAESSTGADDPEDCVVGSECSSWCDPSTWGGTVPDASTDVVIAAGMVVLVDCDAEAGTIAIEEGGELHGSREHSATLTVHGNLVVRGLLDYGRPDERIPADVTAEIVFADIVDDAMVGSPSTVFGEDFGPSADTEVVVVDTDVGLWVEGQGQFDAAGAEKHAWSFLFEGAGPGEATLEVEDASGWRVGDRVVLTPTAMRAEADYVAQFDEATIASIEGNIVELEAAPAFTHAGCTDCVRRGEVANLSRNVVVRSADDTGHAHILVKDDAHVGLDSVELRWLGPEFGEPVCGAPPRRHPLHFHQQDERAAGSFVRHVSIHGGQQGFISVERSDAIEIVDVAGYDTFGDAFVLGYDTSACGTRCTDRDRAPAEVVLTEVLAARVGALRRPEGCARINHRLAGLVVSGDENSGCRGCVATGIGIDSSGSDIAAYHWAEGGSGRPEHFVFEDNIAHDNNGHGAFVWHNESEWAPVFARSAFWSNAQHGVLHGAYGNSYAWADLVALDNGAGGMGLKSIPGSDIVKIDGGRLDGVHVLPYVLVQEFPQVMTSIEFSGERSPAITQFTDACEGNPDDPLDPECSRVMLRFDDPVFPSGTVPFWFGDAVNKHTVWEIRGFVHPDFADLPADFDLYRRDHEVDGGFLVPEFDAWLVPR